MVSIYLDYNASTPVDPAVASAMRPFLQPERGTTSDEIDHVVARLAMIVSPSLATNASHLRGDHAQTGS